MLFKQLFFRKTGNITRIGDLGVVWLLYKPFPNSRECINSLRQNGKTVHFVTNNSTVTEATINSRLNSVGIESKESDIITPLTAVVSYLKEIKFNKKLYTIAAKHICDTLKKEGYNVVEGPHVIEETIPSLLAELTDDKDVGAVFMEFSINLSYMQLQKATIYLKRNDCLFIVGAGDSRLPITPNANLIGPHYFLRTLVKFTNREPTQVAKPSIHYNKYIMERFKISNPHKVLFIGDSITEDMNFANNCGYQKLLVLTGVSNLDNVLNWKHPEEYKPQYYVESLNGLNDIICNCQK